MGESIESGPLSDLQSEDDDEGRRSTDGHTAAAPAVAMAPLVDGRGGASLVQQLLDDVQSHSTDPDVWRKMEVRTHFLLLFITLI